MSSEPSLTSRTSRLLEEASAELARLDALIGIAPPAFGQALRLSAIAQLGAEPSAVSLIAATTDAVHAAVLSERAHAALAFLTDEEARMRDGAALTSARVMEPGITLWDSAAIDAAARAGHTPRPVLLRALAADAAVVEAAAGSAIAALLLCGAGAIERVWLLPFVGVSPGDRAEALAAIADGDHEPWHVAGLTEVARAARARRRAVSDAIAHLPDGEAALDGIGRAAISARAALALLHAVPAITVPQLSDRLQLSRPAAGDALARLVALRLVTEITGRGRDRVFMLTSAFELTAIA